MLGLASYFLPAAFLVAGARRIVCFSAWPWWRWFGFCLLGTCLAVAGEGWELAFFAVPKGGLWGHALYSFFSAYFGTAGMGLFWAFIFLFSVYLLTGLAWLSLLRTGFALLFSWMRRLLESRPKLPSVAALFRRSPSDAKEREEPMDHAPFLEEKSEETPSSEAKSFLFFEAEESVPACDIMPGAEGKALPGANLGFLGAGACDETEPPWVRDLEEGKVGELALRGLRIPPPGATGVRVVGPAVDISARSATSGTSAFNSPPAYSATPQTGDLGDQPAPHVDIREAITTTPAANFSGGKAKRVALPPFSLLHTVVSATEKTPRDVLEAKGKILITCLSDFGVNGELVGIAPGPVVTMFEVRPAAGVRVARIENLSDDLALALKAIAVRVQAPIPGTNTVGIEIPNDVRELVCLKELFCSKAFAESDSLLSMALGKDIQGAPTMADLARMPHLLVAGATGAGKSVCLNSILLSFLYKARPEEVKLLLIDPKRVEMAVYADLPHLVHPVVTEMELAKNALNWAVNEMSRRYNDLALLGVRNITAYNEKLPSIDKSKSPDLAQLEPMPYLVIVIDELADLMMTAAKEVEGHIMRLAQLARAAGIHMILATQRPSVDVVTGLIKANFPCRIAFQVTSKHDSRTILDAVGAEHLLGKGDMLFKPAGGKFRRLHGAFVSDDDVAAVTEYWKSRQKPAYAVDFAEWAGEAAHSGGGASGGGDDIVSDPMYADAVAFVREQGKASISLIQRRFRIGFNRAARFVEQMEQDGVIGPADGSKPRVVR